MKILNILKTIGVILVILVAIGGSLKLISVLFTEHRNCLFSNVDNYEMLTTIDIPTITDANCYYDKEHQLKFSIFQIDRGDIDVDTYIQENNFVQIEKDQISNLRSIFKFSDPQTPLPDEDMLYVRNGSNGRASWYFILEKGTARLWVTIDYTAQLIDPVN